MHCRWDEPIESIEESVHEPHVKRKQRIAALLQIENDGRKWSTRDGWITKRAQINIKQDEYAKAGKHPRTIVDLRPTAAICGNFLMGDVKNVLQSEPFRWGNNIIEFVKSPSLSYLTGKFWECIDSPSRGISHALYHGDDIIMCIPCADGTLWLEADLKSCDSTAHNLTFRVAEALLPNRYRDVAKGIIHQCKSECKLGHSRKFKALPRGPFEYSGSNATTYLNGVSSSITLIGIMSRIDHTQTCDEVEGQVEQFAYETGWAVDLKRIRVLEQFTFLKCFPTHTEDGTRCVLPALAPSLRALGRCFKDLPGSGKLSERGERFNAGVIQSCKHHGDSYLHRSLRNRFNCKEPLFAKGDHLVIARLNAGHTTTGVQLSSYALRYSIPEYCFEELAHLYEESGHGDSILCRASCAILQYDYSFTCPLCRG